MLDGQDHTVKQLAAVLDTTVRNLYYVLDVLRHLGFEVIHEGRYYRLGPGSPFLDSVSRMVDLSREEALYLCDVLKTTKQGVRMASAIQRKLISYYRLESDEDRKQRLQNMENIVQLERAMASKCMAILKGYASPHSKSVKDRVVEPYRFLGEQEDIRAFEVKSKSNKTFKISRIASVELVDTPWFNEEKHAELFTDMFMFSGEERYRVKLRMSILAHRLMLEEFPQSAPHICHEDDTHWILDVEVVSYVAISRFILGLYEDIEILEDDGLRDFVRRKMLKMCQNLQPEQM